MKHSNIVGGSTAKRVMSCPGSVALAQQMPERLSSSAADEGTLLHDVMASILGSDTTLPESLLGKTYEAETFTEELLQEKVLPALAAIDEIDPEQVMQYEVEQKVAFDADVFGSTDLIGRIGDRAIVLDWKFGRGAVDAEENHQLLFYAAAAMNTPETKWAFDGVTEIECVIVQPPSVKRWLTTPDRVRQFETELKDAVNLALTSDAPLAVGDHCKWCPGKPICPKMNNAAVRAVTVDVKTLDADMINTYLKNAELLDGWITDLRALAFKMVSEDGAKLPDFKLVSKRGTRQWANESEARSALVALGLKESDVISLLSPAQAEKVCKKAKVAFPADHAVMVSSGNTLASVDDPRPEVLQLSKLLSKLEGMV